MKRFTLLCLLLILTASIYTQELSVRKERNRVPKQNKTEISSIPKEKNIYPFSVGAEIGVSIDGHLPINFSLEYNRIYYGLTFNVCLAKGTKGEKYKTINWDQFSEDHVKEGNYKQSVTFDLGYRINHFVIGAGIGYLFDIDYRNCFDDLYILGNNGKYYKEKDNGGFDAKGFIMYNFSMDKAFRFYIKAGYDIAASAFLCLGCQF